MKSEASRVPTVFISHSKMNRRRAKRLASLLVLNGVRVWYDEWELLIGHDIYDKVYQGILDADYLALLITKTSLKSSWVMEELSLARQRELDEKSVTVLPLLYEKVDLPLHLKKRKYANFINFEMGFRQLMKVLVKNKQLALVDEALLNSVRQIISKDGVPGIASPPRKLASQAAARLSRQSAMFPEQAKPLLSKLQTDLPLTTIMLHIYAAKVEIPFNVNLDQPSQLALAAILQVLGIPGSAGGSRLSYFLLHDGIPIGLDETLREAGVKPGAELNIGCYSYAIE